MSELLRKEKNLRRPNPADIFYEELFTGRSREGSLTIISDGLSAITRNAQELLDDAKLLFENHRYARAGFLTATADEEMAKVYMLFDMCRLDFEKHENFLKALCEGFYDHVKKYAYNEIARHKSLQRERDKSSAEDVFKTALKTWVPSLNIESDEPDMPHRTYFTRESNLYSEFISYDRSWWIPTKKMKMPAAKPLEHYELSESRNALDRLRYTQDEGFYSAETLDILNDIFSKNAISHKTTTEQILKMYEKTSGKMENDFKKSKSNFRKSALMEWPLYYLLKSKGNNRCFQ